MEPVVCLIWILIIQLTFSTAVPLDNVEPGLEFILLHNNDLHGRFEESTIDETDCPPEAANKCFGGFARISTVLKEYRKDQQSENGKPVLYLNGGDSYVGTPLFHVFRDQITSELMDVLKPDVGALGNHEFDFGVEGLLPFLNNINYPIVAANLNVTANHPLLKTRALKRSVVFNVNNTKIGVVGYILPETKTMSTPGDDVNFSPEISTINNEAELLKKQGANIIIALGHSGYEKDQEIARECPLVDVVVGAHSHTLLYSGTPPDPNDKPLGPYPTIVKQKSGKQVLVVQAYAFSKYLGKLELSFDKEGNLKKWNGDLILLDNKIPRDPEVLKILSKYQPIMDNLQNEFIGHSKVRLNRDCSNRECNVGNFIGDAWIDARVRQYNGTGWTDAAIALMNAGAIRSSTAIGGLSRLSISTILPFNNTLFVVHVPGRIIRNALEFAIASYTPGGYVRTFLQMSGARVVYNLQKSPGERVKSVEVLCANCTVPQYEAIDDYKTYGVIIDQFLLRGGDGFTMFNSFEPINLNMTSFDALINYIENLRVIYPAIEGRIKFAEPSENELPKSHAAAISTSFISIKLIIISLIIGRFVANN